MKRILSTLITLTMLMTSIIEPVIAEESETAEDYSVSVTAEKTEIEIGETLDLNVSVMTKTEEAQAVEGYTAVYASSDESAATVDEGGKVTGVSSGTSTITVTVETTEAEVTKKGTGTLEVTVKAEPTNVEKVSAILSKLPDLETFKAKSKDEQGSLLLEWGLDDYLDEYGDEALTEEELSQLDAEKVALYNSLVEYYYQAVSEEVQMLGAPSGYSSSATKSGSCGSGVQYYLYKSTSNSSRYALVITGSGAISDYTSSSSAPWKGYYIDYLTVGSGVTRIGNYALYSQPYLKTVILPNTLKTIGQNAFNSCSITKKSITIPDSVIEIEKGAFSYGGVISVTLSSSLTKIGDSAFWQCNMESVTVPDTVTSIGKNAFGGTTSLYYHGSYETDKPWGAKGLNPTVDANGFVIDESGAICGYQGTATNIIIPSNATAISSQAFYQNTKITSVTMPDGIVEIGDRAFYGCSNLKTVNLPDTLTTIGYWAFYNCSSLESINIPSGVVSLGGEVFYLCESLKSVTVAEGVNRLLFTRV